MRRMPCLILCCASLWFGTGVGAQESESAFVGKKLTELELEDTFGARISVEDYRGSVLVLLGGTTW
ncbi:MAG: hypothetical protein RDV41_05015 [Planctomycetota bacterium]|nr:hypothetical protein [Planctomycetota bacterium]